jgi:hypothetical protein
MTALNADKWLYAKLTGDAQLLTALGGRVYMDIAPQGTQYPLVVMSFVTSTPVTNVTADRIMDNELWQIAIWDNKPSYTGVETIADRIRDVIHKASGTGVIGAVSEGMPQRLIEQDGDVIYKGLLLEFRIFTQ